MPIILRKQKIYNISFIAKGRKRNNVFHYVLCESVLQILLFPIAHIKFYSIFFLLLRK